MGAKEQAALQLAALPVSVSVVHELPSSQEVGHDDCGSQVSPGSTIPFPQDAEQSSSVVPSQVAGQHPSALVQAVMGGYEQAALQLAALPVSVSVVHELPSSHEVGQDEGGSQVSPGSSTPLPQLAGQSLSEFASQPAGQQPSPAVQVVIGVEVHWASQLAALPVSVSVVQALPSSQDVGQEDGGSQVSPDSTTPLPHWGPPMMPVLLIPTAMSTGALRP
jgi:hypothetical protein